jgi:hypothetical protein
MPREYQKEFYEFMTKIRQDQRFSKASCELSKKCANVVTVKGEVKGQGAYDQMIDIGKEFGLVLLADKP